MRKLLQRLTDARRSGLYRVTAAEGVLDAATGGSLDVVRVDLRDGVFQGMARALAFPDWFGANWDALEDCLGDLSWRRDAGRVLLLSNWPKGDELGTLTEVLSSVAEYWRDVRKPFFAVFIDPTRELELPELYRGA